MDFKTPVGRGTVVLYAAVIALFATAVTVSVVWPSAPLVTTVAWILSTIITMGIALFTSVRWHRPAPVPVMVASRKLCRWMHPAIYDRNWRR